MIRAVEVGGWDEVDVLLEAASQQETPLPLTLVTPPSAAMRTGAAYWKAISEMAQARYPHVVFHLYMDCSWAPGRAMEALYLGVRHLTSQENQLPLALHAFAARYAVHWMPRPTALHRFVTGLPRAQQSYLAARWLASAADATYP
jgi:hypothetical protein